MSTSLCSVVLVLATLMLRLAEVQTQGGGNTNAITGSSIGHSSSTQLPYMTTSSDTYTTTAVLGLKLSSSPWESAIMVVTMSQRTTDITATSTFDMSTATSVSSYDPTRAVNITQSTGILAATPSVVTLVPAVSPLNSSPFTTPAVSPLNSSPFTTPAASPLNSSPFTTPAISPDSSPFTTLPVPTSSSSYLSPATPTTQEASSLVTYVAAGAGGGGGGLVLVLVLCMCCVCCCRRRRRKRSVKLMAKREPPNTMFIQNYNQGEVATFDAGIPMQNLTATMPILTSLTLVPESSTSFTNPLTLPARSKQVPPDFQLNTSISSTASLPSNSKQASPDAQPSNSKQLPPNDRLSSPAYLPTLTNTSSGSNPPTLHGKLPNSSKQDEVRPSTGTTNIGQASHEHSTPAVMIPEIVVIPEQQTEEAVQQPAATIGSKRPVPLPRKKLMKESSNPTEDEYVDPRVFTRDRVLSIVLMENGAAANPNNNGATDEEDLYVAMEHTTEESPPTDNNSATPTSPKYANVVQSQRYSFAGLTAQELEEEYVTMTPELQRQVRRNTDSTVATSLPSQRGGGYNAGDYVNESERGSLLEQVLSSYGVGTRAKSPVLPAK